jgi:hypothetical protein
MLILDKENNLFDQTNEYHFDQNIENIQTGMDSFYIQLGNYKVATLQEQCQKYLKNDP